jgi:hypothetical protein
MIGTDEQREDAYIAQIERVKKKLISAGVAEQKAVDMAVEITKEVAADRRQDIISARMRK